MRIISRVIFVLAGAILINSCSKDIIATDITKKTINVITPIDKDSTTTYSVLFWWDAISGADKYNFQIVKPSFSNIQQLIVDTNIAASQTATTVKYYFTLPPGTYQWRVNATNNAGSTAYITRTITIDTTSNLASQIITLNTPANNSFSKSFATNFSWGSIFTATKYEFYLTLNGATVIHDTILSNSTNPLLPAEGLYNWQVKAINNTSSSPYSNSWAVTIDTTRPSRPTLLTPANSATTTVATSSLSLSWNASTDNLSPSVTYSVYIYTNANDSLGNSAVLTIPSINTSYNYTTASPATTYYWNIVAIDAAGNRSNFSKRWTFKTQ